jgi:hypothetical protein
MKEYQELLKRTKLVRISYIYFEYWCIEVYKLVMNGDQRAFTTDNQTLIPDLTELNFYRCYGMNNFYFDPFNYDAQTKYYRITYSVPYRRIAVGALFHLPENEGIRNNSLGHYCTCKNNCLHGDNNHGLERKLQYRYIELQLDYFPVYEITYKTW